MTISFEEYCEDYLDLDASLMTSDQLKNSRAAYFNLVDNSEKTSSELAKHKKALAKAKESRKLAKKFGGKALSGSAAQKKWAEEIRQRVLESSELSDEQKEKLVTFSAITNTSKFWISNKDKHASLFNYKTILNENLRMRALYSKHYDTLARTAAVHDKELARKEIYEALSSLTIAVTYEFPNCNFYDKFGNLRKELKFRC